MTWYNMIYIFFHDLTFDDIGDTSQIPKQSLMIRSSQDPMLQALLAWKTDGVGLKQGVGRFFFWVGKLL